MWLKNELEEVRMLSAYILSLCSQSGLSDDKFDKFSILYFLRQQYALEEDDVVRFTLLRAITKLDGFSKKELVDTFIATTENLEKLIIALALAKLSIEDLDDEIKKTFHFFIHHPIDEKIEGIYVFIPYSYNILDEILKALSYFSKQKSILFLCDVLDRWEQNPVESADEVSDETLIKVTDLLLELAEFKKNGRLTEYRRDKDGVYTYYYHLFKEESKGKSALTLQQKETVQSIINCNPFWEIRTNILQAYSLPLSKELLTKYLLEQ